ncbi:MAG: hypothetical protein KDB35_21200 [Acidimicrobiales bacterium]|nr:hypothetical protein [Acidimicrobiales bacterium]
MQLNGGSMQTSLTLPSQRAAVLTLSKEYLIERVELWDVKKQAAAVNGFEYFAVRIQQNTDPITRFDAFVQEQEIGD